MARTIRWNHITKKANTSIIKDVKLMIKKLQENQSYGPYQLWLPDKIAGRILKLESKENELAKRMLKKKLVITSVTFRANCLADPNQKYNHIHVEATAAVQGNDNPSDTLNALKEWVASELRIAKGEVRKVETPGRFRV